MLLWVGIYVAVNLIGAAGGYLNRLYMKTLSNRVAKRIRDEVFEHVQTLPVSYFDHLPAGKVVSKITSDTESVRANFYVNGISTLLSTVVMLVGVYVTIFLLNCNAGTRIIIPSSGDDAMAENRCRDAEKILFWESWTVQINWVDS
mgnify:CR=1 FL=1